MKETTFDTAFEKVKKLVENFKQGEKHYLSPSYQEAEVRQDFLDDFFTALGWDVGHKIQHNPYEQEVKVERGVKVSGAQKRADYSFSIAPNFRDPKFFAEAKKPAKALKNAQDYFQSIRYGWHKAHPLSILTDFEELHIIDCRYTPDINNSLDKCYKRFHYTDYLNKEKFAEIYFLFSREAVANGSIEKVSETLPKRKGKATTKTLFPFAIHQTIDEAFLEVIDGIREKLAKSFKKQDENLTSEELTEATQRTVDRLVFIRFLEDKLIEQEHWVSEFGEKGSVWNDFISASKKLNTKYNGIVFKEHFIDKLNFAGPEESEFRNICQDICHLNSRFLFNEIPIHILGSIYERFLGKVVHATDKRVTVEEKHSVRKAGGVYYTPKYVVDYIVNNTVGKLIEGKTPEQITKLRFADIACGSGSFLIGVFECLLDYHNKYYQKHPDKAKKDKCIEKDGLWVLSIKQKQKILLNNIYGVDIDQQATEVTQLSLALKMMEDETTATANEMMVLFHEKILPDMSNNIICGNSLIESDILKINLFEEEGKSHNPIDFKSTFNHIMKNGGFDVIIGNPPYGAELTEKERIYFTKKYDVGNTDTAGLFMIRANELVNNKGFIGFIIPKPFTYNSNWKKIRAKLIPDLTLIVDCNKVWKEVKLEMSIYISNKNIKSKSFKSIIRDGEQFNEVGLIPKNLCEDFGFILNGVTVSEIELAIKMKSSSVVLNDLIINKRGCGLQSKISEKGDYHIIGGKQINRYHVVNHTKGKIHKEDIFDDNCYIKENSILVQNIVSHVYNPKPRVIIIGALAEQINNKEYLILDTINQLENISEFSSRYILGILNSNLICWYTYKFIFGNAVRTMHFDSIATKKIPFPNLSLKRKKDKEIHDEIDELVKNLIIANKNVDELKTDKDKNIFKNKIKNLNYKIEEAVNKAFSLQEKDLELYLINN